MAFVSFMDLGPTLLHLAGISIPEGIEGTPFFRKRYFIGTVE